VNGECINCLPHEVGLEDATVILRDRIRRQAFGAALGHRQHPFGLRRGEQEFVDQHFQPVARKRRQDHLAERDAFLFRPSPFVGERRRARLGQLRQDGRLPFGPAVRAEAAIVRPLPEIEIRAVSRIGHEQHARFSEGPTRPRGPRLQGANTAL
jgi:hypothetical protein